MSPPMTTSTTPAARTQAEATTSSPAGHQEDLEDGEDASLELMHVPWDVVGSYLGLNDVLNLRIASSSLALHMDDHFGYPQCSAWLHDELVRRNVHVFNDTRQWKRARMAPPPLPPRASRRHGGDLNVAVDDDDDDCLLRWLVRSNKRGHPRRTTTTTPASGVPASLDDVPHPQQNSQVLSSPFNLLLRCLRVIRYLPQQLTVAYSGKYGRHCWGLVKDHSSVIQYTDCHRGGKNHCATCRTRIETVPFSATATTTTSTQSSSDRTNGSDDDDIVTIDMTLQIPVGMKKKNPINNSKSVTGESRHVLEIEPRRCVRLDAYHNKCIPNLPSDLACPVCRVVDRRTLVLAELSYQTEPGTERIASHHRSFTFTPAQDGNDEDEDDDDDDDDEGPPRRKRRRLHEEADTEPPFPPRYRESFLYQYYEDNVAMDVKHAVSIHCDHCRQFGVLSPAQLDPLEGWGRILEERRDPSMRHVLFSSAFLQRAPPQPR